MDQIAHMMSEIARLRIENAKLRKNILVRQNIMGGEPSHLRSISIMFSDNKGFDQFAGPDYGSRTRAERAGFMSMQGGKDMSEERNRYLLCSRRATCQ
jgi:hypothetical protein